MERYGAVVAEDQQTAEPRGFRTGRWPKVLVGLIFAATLAAVPGTAMAEGGWGSSLNGVSSGFMSRIWTDRNLDNNATKLDIGGCSRTDGAQFVLVAELFRDVWGPDPSLGRRDVSACNVVALSVNWGNPGPGNYYLRFWHHNFGLVSARSIFVSY